MSRRINALIPDELYERLNDSDLSITKVVNDALNYYLDNKNELDNCKNELKTTQNELEKLKDLQNALRESNQILTKELEEAGKRENNYMLQMQQQITAKDSQLEKQAVHIQSLIQENSKLNVKLLPENTKKPWYKFW